MWDRFSEPPLVLSPKHAAVFRRAAADLSDCVGWQDWDDEWPGIGIAVFDSLSQGQKQAAIFVVSRALLDPDCEPPEITAVLAGTVDAIYRNLEAIIETEISLGEDSTARRMILDAMDERNYWNELNSSLGPDEEPEVRLTENCDDTGKWADLIEDMRTEILEDYDFEMAGKFLDLPPAQATALKEMMNIEPDYFVAVIEDPTRQRLTEIELGLQHLLNPVREM